MIVNEDGPAANDVRDVASDVYLSDGFCRQRIQVPDGVDADIVRADKDVVDVAKQAAAGFADEFAQKDRFAHRRMPETEIAGGILDQDRSPDRTLYLVDMGDHDVERLF